MGKVYYDKDGDINVVRDKVVAIIGYGNQGRSQALNMRDSGVQNIIVGSIHDASWNTANEDGFHTYSIAEAAKKADILFLLLPDEVAPEIYERDIAPNLHPGAALNFASGYNITYGFIKPAADLDVIMVAPRMIGKGVRETYENGTGFPTFLVVNQDATGHAKEIALGLAKALGSTKAGAIEVTFNDETYLDLMSEQAIWPLIMNVFVTAFDFYQEKGLPAESGLSLSNVIRSCINRTEIRQRQPAEINDLYREINRIGVNINQIARSVNAGIATRQDAKEALFLLRQVYLLMEKVADL